MNRREVIVLLGGTAVSWPPAMRAAQLGPPSVVFLSVSSADRSDRLVQAFRKGLSDTGLIEGHTIGLEFHWAENRRERLPEMVADLITRQPKVIVTGTPGAFAARAATSSIPIIFVTGIDPVVTGLVPSLNRPSGNLTGISVLTAELLPKCLELLHELIPSSTTIGLLVNPANPATESLMQEMRAAASSLGKKLNILNARTDGEIDGAVATFSQPRSALVVGADPLFESQLPRITAFAARKSLPTIYPWRDGTTTGGLMSYGADFAEAYRQAAVYTGRILRGDKPADLPVMQSSKFELLINLKTAKALGLDVPPMLLARADEVIE
jgi:putative ABC transport system substrate-binding protein